MSLSMTKAKAMKIDEFYTQFSDIEEELVHYKKFFFKKKVYCSLIPQHFDLTLFISS